MAYFGFGSTNSGYSKDEFTFLEEPPKLLELECPIYPLY